MGIVSAVAIYFIIWWLLFYLVLTIGNRRPEAEENLPRGAERGAPAETHLRRRVAATTVGAFVLLGAFYALINSGITLDDVPLPNPPRLGEVH